MEQPVTKDKPGAASQKPMMPGKTALLRTSLLVCPDPHDLDKPVKLSAETGSIEFGATASNIDTNELTIEP